MRRYAIRQGKTGGLYSLFLLPPNSTPLMKPSVGYWGRPIETLNDRQKIMQTEYLGPQPGQTYEAVGSHGYELRGNERFPPREIDGIMLPRELLASTRRQPTTPTAELDAAGTPVEQFNRGRSRWRRDSNHPTSPTSQWWQIRGSRKLKGKSVQNAQTS